MAVDVQRNLLPQVCKESLATPAESKYHQSNRTSVDRGRCSAGGSGVLSLSHDRSAFRWVSVANHPSIPAPRHAWYRPLPLSHDKMQQNLIFSRACLTEVALHLHQDHVLSETQTAVNADSNYKGRAA